MKKYIISEEELKKLIEDSWELNRLMINGVDNWEGYYEGSKNEEEENIDIYKYIKGNFEEVI